MFSMNKIHLLVISCLTLTGCFSLSNPKVPGSPKIPENIPEIPEKTEEVPVEETEEIEEEEEQVEIDENKYIEVIDYASKYYVGETLYDAFRGKVTLIIDDTEKDLTYKRSHFNFVVKDGNGQLIDCKKPFNKAGDYTYQLIYLGDEKIRSEELSFSVLETPGVYLKDKTKLPEGFNYSALENSCLSNLSFPTSGDINVLVIPVEIKDFPFASSIYGSSYREKIDAVFNGNSESETGYWESVSSYYKKASLNKLNFTFDITDTYECGSTTEELAANGIYASLYEGRKAIKSYKDKYGGASLQKYDNDNDGYIDGVWLVYSAPDYGSYPYEYLGSDLFWAFCTDDVENGASISSPNLHSFGWASISFMNTNDDPNKVDSHTFIHETGHLLGLPDYYSYDVDGGILGAQGGLAMMDLNIGDQDAFSKMALGWADPYYPDEDCVVTIKSNGESGDCILLADSWNGTAFDEYVLLDLVTPTYLNELDSSEVYPDRPLFYSQPGIRAYHIDSRLGEFKYYFSNESFGSEGIREYKNKGQSDYYLTDELVEEVAPLGEPDRLSTSKSQTLASRTPGYTVINANSSSRALIQSSPYYDNRLITLVGADQRIIEGTSNYANNDSLFKVGDSWTLDGRTSKFFNSDLGKFNNNDNFSFVFSVLACDDVEATILIKKVEIDA